MEELRKGSEKSLLSQSQNELNILKNLNRKEVKDEERNV